jgi:pimeloyl-ACP methyl ester carboxylesterase
MRPSESTYHDIRRLRYHVRRWAGTGPRVVLLHGWMDVSASFQFLVDALPAHWDVYAPDWRGYGLSEWSGADCYWFPDYMADLDQLLERIQPDAPVLLVGHSLGGNVATHYSGVRPERIRMLANFEGFGMSTTKPEQAPDRFARWMSELREPPGFRPYDSFGALADRMQKGNPRLTRERADFLARHWGQEMSDGKVVLRSDPAHKLVNANLSRVEESRACWARVTAPVLWVDAELSETATRMKLTNEEQAERRKVFPNLRYETVAGAGHMLHHDQPEAVARLLAEFFAC